MCAGTPRAAQRSYCRRRAPTAASASGTGTTRAVRRGMLASVQRAVLIVNPYSTKVTGDRIARVEATLREQVELRTEFTRAPGHATELAAEAAGKADAIVVFAGDGTYNEALNGADGALPFGFLPGGGTSVFPVRWGCPAIRARRRVPSRRRSNSGGRGGSRSAP